MIDVGFNLIADSNGFLVGVAEASNELSQLQNETKLFEQASTASFKGAAQGVQSATDEIIKGSKQTSKFNEEVTKLGKTKNAVQQLKQEIKFYTSEAYKAGEGTKAFTENLRKAGQLKDQLQDLNKAVESLNGNIGENFARAAGNSIGLVSKGFEGVIALEVLAGDKSKEFEQTLLKLQSLNAIAGLAQEFGGLGDKITEIKLGVQGLFTIIKNNPVGAFIALLTAAAAAFVFLKDKLDIFGNAEERRYKRLLEDSEAYIDALKQQYDYEIALADAAGKNTAVVENQKTKAVTHAINQRIEALYKLEQIEGELNDEQTKQLNDYIQQYDELVNGSIVRNVRAQQDKAKAEKDILYKTQEAKISQLKSAEQRELAELDLKYKKEVDALSEQMVLLYNTEAEQLAHGQELFNAITSAKEAQRNEIRKKYAEERLRKQKALDEEYANFLIQIAKRVQDAELNALSGEDRIKKEQEIALNELSILKSQLIEKGKAKDKNFKLSQAQQEQFSILEQDVYRSTTEKLIALEVERANSIAQAKFDASQSAAANLATQEANAINAVNLTARPEETPEAQFELQKQKAILEIQRDFASQKLEIKQQELANERQLQLTELNGQLELIKDKNDKESNLKREQISTSLALIEEKFALEGTKIQDETANQINAIQKQIEETVVKLSAKKPFNLAELLGITPAQLSAIQQTIAQLGPAINEIFKGQQALIDNQIKNSEKLINERQKTIDELESQLGKEQALNEEGFANNSNLIKQKIEEEAALKQQEVEREKELREEKKRLARIQIATDTVIQGSNMVTAVTEIYKGLALIDPTGISGSIAAAAMVAAFLTQKANALAAIDNDNAFKDGVIDLQGPGTSTSDSINARLSKGESVMTAEETKQNMNLFKGIRNKDSKLLHSGIMDLAKNYGLMINGDIPNALVQKRNFIKDSETSPIIVTGNDISSKHLLSINEKIYDVLSKEKNNKIYNDVNGNLVIQNGSHKQVIRKR